MLLWNKYSARFWYLFVISLMFCIFRRANLEASKLKIEEEDEDEEEIEKLEARKKQAIQELQEKMDEEIRKTEMEMRQVLLCFVFIYLFEKYVN